jgi:hypothetical protein
VSLAEAAERAAGVCVCAAQVAGKADTQRARRGTSLLVRRVLPRAAEQAERGEELSRARLMILSVAAAYR